MKRGRISTLGRNLKANVNKTLNSTAKSVVAPLALMSAFTTAVIGSILVNQPIEHTATCTVDLGALPCKDHLASYNFYDYQADSMKIKHNLNDATVND